MTISVHEVDPFEATVRALVASKSLSSRLAESRAIDPAAEVDSDGSGEDTAPSKGQAAIEGGETAWPVMSLADVLRCVETVAPSHRQVEARSAIRMAGRVLGRELKDISAAPSELSRLMAEATPALMGMKRQRWDRIRSLIRWALATAGIEVLAGRNLNGLSPQWIALARQLSTRRLRYGLSRAMSYFSSRDIRPDQVDAAALEELKRLFLRANLDARAPLRFRIFGRLWNEAASTVPDWPKVVADAAVPRRGFTVDPGSLPAEFQADLEAFLACGRDADPFADNYAPALRPITIANRRMEVRILVSGLLASGFPIEKLTGLAVLTNPENARAALRTLRNRAGTKPSPQLGNLARLLCTIGRYWVEVSPADNRILRRMAAAMRVRYRGMTPKNRRRLKQFDLQHNRLALLNLPERVFAQTPRSGVIGKHRAIRLMNALAVDLLTVGAMRVNNLAGLEIGRHVISARSGGQLLTFILIREEETKTGVPVELILPPDTASRVRSYISKWRELVCPESGPYLFPGLNGRRRQTGGFAAQIASFIHAETGLVVNPHLFRHLVGKLYLEERPEDIETVRRVLGHKTTETTLRAYAELRNEAAFRQYDQTITGLRRRIALTKPVGRSRSPKGSR